MDLYSTVTALIALVLAFVAYLKYLAATKEQRLTDSQSSQITSYVSATELKLNHEIDTLKLNISARLTDLEAKYTHLSNRLGNR